MGLFDKLNVQDATIYPLLNTGTFLDISTGIYELNNGKWLLNGGLPPLFGVAGRGGFYKTTTTDGLALFTLLKYPQSELIKLETENNTFAPKKRFETMLSYTLGANNPKIRDIIDNRIRVTNSTVYDQEQFEQLLKDLCAEKAKNKKDLMVETPFVDAKTGELLKMWIPTFVIIDSFTLWRSVKELENVQKYAAGDSKRNMDNLTDGQVKRKLMMQFSQWAYQYGIYFLLTAQVDDSYVADEYNRPEKQNQWTKQNDRFKSVGPLFEFLTNTLLQNFAPSPIVQSTDRKQPEYSVEGAGLVEINELSSRILRCKTGATGLYVPMIASQNYGLLPGLTYYHFLKKNEDFGFNTNGVGKVNRYPLFMPDVLLKRTNVIDTLSNNYELNRALEIMAQLKWIQLYWNTKKFEFSIPETAEQFMEGIVSHDLAISDILNSRGYWTYSDDDNRTYMSTMDILSIIGAKK